MSVRRFDDANLWSGVYRHTKGMWHDPIPTVVVTVRLRYWSLPLSISAGAHLLSKPGVTVGIGPLYFSWSWL